MIDLGRAKKQKEFTLEPDSLLTAKKAGPMAGVLPNRIAYSAEDGIIIPAHKTQKGDGILTYSFYDCVNVLELFLINKLTEFRIPKKTIKELFESIRNHRNALNPFKIESHKKGAFLIFYFDSDGKLNFEFTEKKSLKSAVLLVVNLKQLVSDLFKRIESLP